MQWGDEAMLAFPCKHRREARASAAAVNHRASFDYSASATTAGVRCCRPLQLFLWKHVCSGPNVWQYCRDPPHLVLPPIIRPAHCTEPGELLQTQDAHATSTNMPAHWLPGPVPWTAAAAEVLTIQPDVTADKVDVPYDVAKRFKSNLRQAPAQLERGTPAATEAAEAAPKKPSQKRQQQHILASVKC